KKLSVAHGGVPRVDPTRGFSHLAFSMRDRRGNAMATMQVGSVPALLNIFCLGKPRCSASRIDSTRRHALALVVLALMVGAPGSARAAGPEGQLTWGVHISLAPTWFDPAETPGIITPFMVMYALHDAMVKPMPGQPLAPSLAESWSLSDDGLIYEFVLRKSAK